MDNTLLMHEENSQKQLSGDLFDLEFMIQNYVLATLMQARNGILERAPPGVLEYQMNVFGVLVDIEQMDHFVASI